MSRLKTHLIYHEHPADPNTNRRHEVQLLLRSLDQRLTLHTDVYCYGPSVEEANASLASVLLEAKAEIDVLLKLLQGVVTPEGEPVIPAPSTNAIQQTQRVGAVFVVSNIEDPKTFLVFRTTEVYTNGEILAQVESKPKLFGASVRFDSQGRSCVGSGSNPAPRSGLYYVVLSGTHLQNLSHQECIDLARKARNEE